MTNRVSNRDARRAILWLQGLADQPRQAMQVPALLGLIDRLGFVQLDSIQTVARAHHMILRARSDSYRPALLERAFMRERALFEHWTHDAALIPVAFYPHWNRRFLRNADTVRERFAKWHGGAFVEQADAVLARVRAEGALKARDFAEPGKRREGGWWRWHDGKIALEYLWRVGRLAVAGRDGFEKLYDLAERVVPEPHVGATTTAEDFVDWACASALDRLAVAAPGDIARFWDLAGIEDAKAWCRQAEHRGALRRVAVAPADGGPDRPLLARPDLAEVLAAAPEPPGRIRALSPFDPLLRDRRRLELLFGFHYRIEVFVPAAKRAWGYYVFPLLERDRLIGRIDMAADRAGDALAVTALWLEPGVALDRGRTGRLEAELDRVRRFAGLGRVAIADGWRRS